MAQLLAVSHIGDMKIAEKIILASDRRGLSQARVERLAGLPAGRLSKWSKGKGEPTGGQCWRIAEVLNVPISWLLDDGAGGEPPTASDDQLILRVFHALGITADDAIRGMNWAVARNQAVPNSSPPDFPTFKGNLAIRDEISARQVAKQIAAEQAAERERRAADHEDPGTVG